MESVGSKLLSEIERVSAKRERWKGYANELGQQVSFGPSIFLMTAAIDGAKEAIQSGDPIVSIRALRRLEEYGDEDWPIATGRCG